MKEEIRKALEEATPEWHDNGNEIVSLRNPKVGIGGFLREQDNHLAANAPTWLRWQNERIEELEKSFREIKEREMRHYKYETDIYHIADQALGKEE